jgi:hypothetical protein
LISIHGGEKVDRISLSLLKIIAAVSHLLIESTELFFFKKKLAAGAILILAKGASQNFRKFPSSLRSAKEGSSITSTSMYNGVAVYSGQTCMVRYTSSVSFYLSLDSTILHYPATNKKKRKEYYLLITKKL